MAVFGLTALRSSDISNPPASLIKALIIASARPVRRIMWRVNGVLGLVDLDDKYGVLHMLEKLPILRFTHSRALMYENGISTDSVSESFGLKSVPSR